MERGLSHSLAVGRLKILQMIQVSSSEGEHAFWHSGMQMCASLYSNVAFWMLSSQGIGVSVEVWVEQGALPTAVSSTLNDLCPQGNIHHMFHQWMISN